MENGKKNYRLIYNDEQSFWNHRGENIFNLNYKQLDIIIHPTSYVHAIIKFNDGMIKIIAHDTTMKIQFLTQYILQQEKI